ncbi:hypothetical protein BD414DRAFT_443707 [Trametes punicea]|nr:hypothetical protein BD414DRAFT_443707 [Trametes punicea]
MLPIPLRSLLRTFRIFSLCATRRPVLCPDRVFVLGAYSHGPSLAPVIASGEPMPPNYELQSYWNKRFDEERHFEWLGDGMDTIVPHVRSHLLDSRANARPSPSSPPRLLHVGAGTSSLPERLRELYIDVYGDDVDERMIVHTDFADHLVTRKREAEEARRAVWGPRKGMRWLCADALKWPELKGLLELKGHLEPKSNMFDLVVDKSTSDAISCGEDVSYVRADTGIHPTFSDFLAGHEGRRLTLSPVEVFAVHLSSLVRPGGLWIALTFSSNRFAFLSPLWSAESSLSFARNYWAIERMITVDAPTGLQGNAHAPMVQHYIYLIRRKEAMSG